MGSSAHLVRQCMLLVAAVAIIALVCPYEAKVWVAMTGAVALVFFVSISLLRHRDVRRLAFEIDEVLHKGRRVDFTNSKEGDIAVLSNELAKMVGRLSKTSEQLALERNALADSLADVSHQIRTPLTAITLMLPAIERAEDPIERKAALRKLEVMIGRVSWLVTTLLKIAKIDAGAMHVERKDSSCEDVVHRAIMPLETALDLRGIQLEIDIDADASVFCDVPWTAEAIENIVKNCMEHTPCGGTIAISAQEDALATTIAVSDTGSGIDPADLPYIFDRFYRGRQEAVGASGTSGMSGASDTSNASGATLNPSGFGIGLSLAQALISAQDATIRVSNGEEGGARFVISFPKVVV